MKKTVTILLSLILLFPCMLSVRAFAETQSTMVRYTVNPTVVYMDYDGTRTTQKVELGKTLKEPSHKGKKGYRFAGWKNLATGDFWNYSDTVEENLMLVACYSQKDDGQSSEVQLGEGTFSIDIRVKSGTSGVNVGTDKVKLMDMLIDDGSITTGEITQIANGASMDIVLVVQEGDSTISEASRAQIESRAGEYTVGQYLDISLYKYLTVNGKTGRGYEISQTSGMITVSVKLKDSLLNTDGNIERTYLVLRNHEGNVEILPSSYNADTHILTFQTNQFSDYAIAYKDTKKADSTADSRNSDDQNQNSDTAAQKNVTAEMKSSPATGDDMEPGRYGTVLLISAMAASVLLIKRKREKQ